MYKAARRKAACYVIEDELTIAGYRNVENWFNPVSQHFLILHCAQFYENLFHSLNFI